MVHFRGEVFGCPTRSVLHYASANKSFFSLPVSAAEEMECVKSRHHLNGCSSGTAFVSVRLCCNSRTVSLVLAASDIVIDRDLS